MSCYIEISITDALNFAEIKEPKPTTPKDPKGKKVDPPVDWKRAIVIQFSHKITQNMEGQFGKLEDYLVDKSEVFLIEDWDNFYINYKVEKELNEVCIAFILYYFLFGYLLFIIGVFE